MFVNKQIKIMVNNQPYVFACNLCRSFYKCMNGTQCQILDYISTRLPNVHYGVSDRMIHIDVQTNDIDKANMVVLRAIRKRCVNCMR